MLTQLVLDNCERVVFQKPASCVLVLHLINSKIQNLTDIYQMLQLVVLDLSSNNIKYISELGALVNLKILNIQNNDVYVIDSLKNLLNLQQLNISNNKIILCEPLKDLKINELKCNNNKFIDLEHIIYMTNYQFDWLHDYTCSQATLKDYKEYLGDNFSSDKAVQQFKESNKLKLKQTNIILDDIKFCNEMKYINNIVDQTLTIENESKLNNMQFTDLLNINILVIKKCKQLIFERTPKKITQLTVNYCEIYSVKGIEQMTQLTILNLNQNNLLLIAPVAQLVNLTQFSAKCNYIQDFHTLNSIKQINNYICSQNTPDIKICEQYLRVINNQQVHAKQLLENVYDVKMINKYRNQVKRNILTVESDSDLTTFSFTDQLEIQELILINCDNVSFERTPLKVKNLSVRGSYSNLSKIQIQWNIKYDLIGVIRFIKKQNN
ncbi:leucine-rich_repeat domain-containing protein [Hexamita inflata]|uniref:Leucine-rich repeat domain-containing protein n=1 Tax=Hexamita inflata TaxID=28002 RepID=A0AA86QVV0_9EUKA|nr:leucine-rich repeat domain-containing protein [Hexamita inflata]